MSHIALGTKPSLTRRPGFWGPALAALLLLMAGLGGGLSAAWGYGLFLAAGALLACGVAVFGVFVLTRWGDDAALKRLFVVLLVAGAWAYLFAVCALAGHFGYETLQGRMDLKWIVFGPAILAALVALDYGLYRRLAHNNLPTWRRYRQYISRQASDPGAMRATLVGEVLLHKSLFSVSRLRWLRHALIFWGFMLMFFTELVAVGVREAMPAFGLSRIWEDQSHPLRLAFDFLFDLFGLMVLAGCLLALVWRAMVNGTEERKFSDTPSAVFLLLVVASGFVVEAMRIAGSPPHALHAVSFAGYATALLLPRADWLAGPWYQILWLAHVLGSCLFIAYVPVKRLIHSCAVPMGRLMNSQQGLLAARKRGVLAGLLVRGERRP